MGVPLTRTQVKIGVLLTAFGFFAEGWAGAALEFTLVLIMIIVGHVLFTSDVDREMGRQVDTRPYTVIVHRPVPEDISIEHGWIRIHHRVYRAREYDGRAYDTPYRVRQRWEDRDQWTVEEIVREPIDEIDYESVLADPFPESPDQ